MTPKEMHEYNKSHAVAGISYPAVAYEAGYNNAKNGEL